MSQPIKSKLFFKNTVQDKIHIHPKFLHSNLDIAIISQIQQKVEGICNRDGYVKKKSTQLLKRSIGMASSNNTNGYVSFDVLYSVDVCNPSAGDIYPCIVKKTNKIGFLADPIEKPNPLVIVVVKQHVENKDLLNSIKEGEYVFIKIIGSRFDLGDDKISVVGNLIERISASDIPSYLKEDSDKNGNIAKPRRQITKTI